MRFLTVLMLLSISASPAVADEPLKIMSWNIANLSAETGVGLRHGSHARTSEDFERIADVISTADPDIVALQEIGSIAAAQRVLPRGFNVQLEQRCAKDGDGGIDVSSCATEQGDIFTAIAWKRDLPIRRTRVIQWTNLSMLHVSECGGNGRYVRGGVGIEFTYEGDRYSVVSVHLKASCPDEDSNDPLDRPDLVDDCNLLDEQFAELSRWISGQLSANKTVVVAGDYNRKLLESGDRHKALLESQIDGVRFEPSEHPSDYEQQCWPRNYPQSRSHRAEQTESRYGPPIGRDGRRLSWVPYMPSSVETRDFFVIAGPQADRLGSSDMILLRPEELEYDPTPRELPETQRVAIERQAAEAGVRFGPPGGYLSECRAEDDEQRPIPKPFFQSTAVLSFHNLHPSDHCPITIELGAGE